MPDLLSRVEAFNRLHNAEMTWLYKAAAFSSIYESLYAHYSGHGSLSDEQLALVREGMAAATGRKLKRWW